MNLSHQNDAPPPSPHPQDTALSLPAPLGARSPPWEPIAKTRLDIYTCILRKLDPHD